VSFGSICGRFYKAPLRCVFAVTEDGFPPDSALSLSASN